MTKEEALKLYLDTYKASAKQAADWNPPQGFKQGVTPHDLVPTNHPTVDRYEGFVKDPGYMGNRWKPDSEAAGYVESYSGRNQPVFTMPTNEQYGTYSERQKIRKNAINNYQKYLKQRVSPQVPGVNYAKDRNTVHLTPNEIKDRIRMLKEQQGQDKRIYKANTPMSERVLDTLFGW